MITNNQYYQKGETFYDRKNYTNQNSEMNIVSFLLITSMIVSVTVQLHVSTNRRFEVLGKKFWKI